MMAPSILARDGEVRAVLGSGGSKRIRTALLQAVSLIVDFDFSVRDAVEAPRLHWDGEQMQVLAVVVDEVRLRFDVIPIEEVSTYDRLVGLVTLDFLQLLS